MLLLKILLSTWHFVVCLINHVGKKGVDEKVWIAVLLSNFLFGLKLEEKHSQYKS